MKSTWMYNQRVFKTPAFSLSSNQIQHNTRFHLIKLQAINEMSVSDGGDDKDDGSGIEEQGRPAGGYIRKDGDNPDDEEQGDLAGGYDGGDGDKPDDEEPGDPD